MYETGFVLSIAGSDPGPVALAGDWHGNLWWAERALRVVRDVGAREVVQLGDFGYWRGGDPATRKYLFRLNRMLTELDMRLYWVDGNHEDHRRLRAQPLAADGTRPITERLIHLPRGHRWTWHDADGAPHTWLALGGAVSVDRDGRVPGRTWWPEEEISDEDVAASVNGGPVDVMVTHDAPSGVPVPGASRGDWPANVVRDANLHRARLRQVVDVLRPRELWHGHYHVRHDATLDLASKPSWPAWSGECHVHGLDRDDTDWKRNLGLAGADGRPLQWPAVPN